MIDNRIITPIQGKKVVAATTVPEAVTAAQTAVQSVEFIAQKDQGSANTGNIWIGVSGTDATCNRLMATGTVMTMTASPGSKLDLSLIFIDVATNGDGVTFTAIP